MSAGRGSNDGLDDISVRDSDDRFAGVQSDEIVDRIDGTALHLAERLTTREAETARVPLHCAPLGQLAQFVQLLAGPIAEVTFDQPFGLTNTQLACLRDRRGGSLEP